MTRRIPVAPLLAALLAAGCGGSRTDARQRSHAGVSLSLVSRAATFELSQVPRGAVGFTALIRNDGKTTVTVAHPSICLPAGAMPGKTRRFSDAHGNSEILLTIWRPDGTTVTLRDGFLHGFDPGNRRLLTIPPATSMGFDLGWFFENARGRWETDSDAAKVFLSKGGYRVRLLLRNRFPRAALHDEAAEETRLVDVWTGELESPEISVAVM